MEQALEARDQEPAEARVEAVEAAKAGEGVLQQARAVIAFAPTVVKEQPINWGAPVMSRIARSAERQ